MWAVCTLTLSHNSHNNLHFLRRQSFWWKLMHQRDKQRRNTRNWEMEKIILTIVCYDNGFFSFNSFTVDCQWLPLWILWKKSSTTTTASSRPENIFFSICFLRRLCTFESITQHNSPLSFHATWLQFGCRTKERKCAVWSWTELNWSEERMCVYVLCAKLPSGHSSPREWNPWGELEFRMNLNFTIQLVE